jgi:hypothetical protein
MTDHTGTTPPIVCDMTDAPDTAHERIAEYERLFTEPLIGRERTDSGIRFRFRAVAGVEEWVQDLAAREKACCAFFDYTISAHQGEIWWDMTVVDDELARRLLDEFYRLPDSIADGGIGVLERFTGRGLQVMIKDSGGMRPATTAELGFETSS